MEIGEATGAGAIPAPQDLGLRTLAPIEILAVVKRLPRQPALMLLSRLVSHFDVVGQVDRKTNADFARLFLPEHCLGEALAWLGKHQNGVFFSYELGVRLAHVVHVAGNASNRQMNAPELRHLGHLLLSLQVHLSAGINSRRPTTPLDTRSVMSRTGGAPFEANAESAVLGALALRNLKPRKKEKVAIQALEDVLGLPLAVAHAALFRLTCFLSGKAIVVDEREEIVETAAPETPARAESAADLGGRERALTQMLNRMAALASMPAIGRGDAGALAILQGADYRVAETKWTPLVQQEEAPGAFLCIDPGLLRDMLGFRLQDWLTAISPAHEGALSSLFSHAVEKALDEMLGPTPMAWRSVSLPRYTGSACDRLFESTCPRTKDAHLFLCEIKNTRAPETLGDPERRGQGFQSWMESVLFADKSGFGQVNATIEAMWKIDSDSDRRRQKGTTRQPLRRYRRVWPMVVTYLDVPTDPITIRYVRQHYHAMESTKRLMRKSRTLARLIGPPMVVSFREFLFLAEHADDLQAVGASPMDALKRSVNQRRLTNINLSSSVLDIAEIRRNNVYRDNIHRLLASMSEDLDGWVASDVQ